MTLYMHSSTKNAIKNAIYACEGKYNLHYAFHALDNEDDLWLIRIRVSDEKYTLTSPDLVIQQSSMTRDGILAVMEVITQDFWRAKDRH